MIITRKPGESDQDFRARAFTAARENSANMAQQLSVDEISLTWSANMAQQLSVEHYRWNPVMDVRPRHKWHQATPMSWPDYKAARTVTELAEPTRMSRLRAIWYTCGLVAASAVIAMAVFGMGS